MACHLLIKLSRGEVVMHNSGLEPSIRHGTDEAAASETKCRRGRLLLLGLRGSLELELCLTCSWKCKNRLKQHILVQ